MSFLSLTQLFCWAFFFPQIHRSSPQVTDTDNLGKVLHIPSLFQFSESYHIEVLHCHANLPIFLKMFLSDLDIFKEVLSDFSS